MSKIIRVGIDLSKSVFVLYGRGGRDNNRTLEMLNRYTHLKAEELVFFRRARLDASPDPSSTQRSN